MEHRLQRCDLGASAVIPPVSPNAVNVTVPHNFHQIWLGPSVPQLVTENWAIWDDALDGHWRVERWDDDRVRGHTILGPMVDDLRDAGVKWRGVTDVIRLWILALHGGVYMDGDAYPAGDISTLASVPAWVGQRAGTRAWSLHNGSLGFPPYHPYLARVLSRADSQRARGVILDHYFAGPITFWNAYKDCPTAERPQLRMDTTSMIKGHLDAVMRGETKYDRAQAVEENPNLVVIHP